MSSSDRIDGWKAIGAHFNRDRTTVMRWAQTRAPPVRRIPGGKRATVYALKSDLDRWALSHADVLADLAAPEAKETSVRPEWRIRPSWVAAGLAAGLLAGVMGWVVLDRPTAPRDATVPAAIALPTDPALARLYLQARDDWAERTPDGLTRAVAALETVTRQAPAFAPAFAALADAYLLQREFGAMPDGSAFEAARKAATSALAKDPDLASAHRALGFVQYWRDNRPAASGVSFRRAIELAPENAQSHFWYGNVLAHNGQAEAAARELNRARLLQPGSIAIQTDIAWADWSSGRETQALEALTRLVRTAPDFPVAYDCLAIVRLSGGDYAGYVAAYGRYARLRGDPALITHARALDQGMAEGAAAVQALLATHAMSGDATRDGRDHGWAAFVVSVSGDRLALIGILERAVGQNERWGSAGLRGAIARRWAADPDVLGLLRRLEPPLVE